MNTNTIDLVHIRDILDHQRRQRIFNPDHMTLEADLSCELLIQAIDEGRVQIIPRKP